MDRKQTVVFIHGLGDSPSAWDYHIAALPDEFTGVAVEVPGVTSGGNGDGFSLDGAARGMVAELDRLGIERAHFVGLSLGAMLAFEVAASYPERISSLTLAAGQVKPPRALMAVQNAIMRFLPARFVAQGSANKEQMLAVLRTVATADFTPRLATIGAPTLVLCGSKDRANLAAARMFATGIHGAELRIIKGVGHQSNVQAPERFSELLNKFLMRHA